MKWWVYLLVIICSVSIVYLIGEERDKAIERKVKEIMDKRDSERGQGD